MKQFYRLAALFLALLLLCGCAAGNGYGKPERMEGQDEYLTDPVPEGKPQPVEPQDDLPASGGFFARLFG